MQACDRGFSENFTHHELSSLPCEIGSSRAGTRRRYEMSSSKAHSSNTVPFAFLVAQKSPAVSESMTVS